MKFVFDLDGTICFKGQPVSERILTSLEYVVEQGHDVIFASARPIRDLLPVLPERFHHYPMIGGNGCMVAEHGELLAVKAFDNEVLATITQVLQMHHASYLIDSEWDYAYTGAADHPIMHNLDPQRRANNVALEQLSSVVKVLVLTADDMDAVEQVLSDLPVVIHHHANERTLDISPNGIDKWSGLQQLAVVDGDYIAFGNDANDIAMFQHAKYTVMIGNNEQLAPYASEQLLGAAELEERIADKLHLLAKKYTV